MKDFYTIKELADKHSVSTRTIERHLKSLVLKEKNKILIPKDTAKLIEQRHKYDTSTTQENEPEYDIVEGFSNEEYQEFQKRLIEYPTLQKDLEYHRNSALSHQRQMEMLLTTMMQKNIIEFKSKNLDNGV